MHKNKDLRDKLMQRANAKKESRIVQLMQNLGNCANNAPQHDKYQWLLPQQAKSNGLTVGKTSWTRANKLFNKTQDVAARVTRNSKVSVLSFFVSLFML